ncbi:MAG: hypothetical protein PHS92_01200 [Candidatus Gracilibacteria bacterium]|nr:hypothetical protein [Candidatus Gracilibacteria bacterium]
MITYHINRFIHSIIRENKLVYIMELLLSEGKKEDILFSDFIRHLKIFLQKENDQIFDDTRLKYMLFIEDFKNNVENMKDLKEKDNIETNSLLFKIYELPKKRNNLLLVFLVYFYIKNKNKLWGDEIFKIIYVYFMIIVYRNRMPKGSREKLIDIDNRDFKTIREVLSDKFRFLTRRYVFIKSRNFKLSLSFIMITSLSILGYLNLSGNLLKADIIGASNNAAFGKVAFDSIMIGRVSDPIISSIQNFGLQNILLLVAFALLIQSFKTSLSTVFFNSVLTKIFQFLWIIVKYISRIIFFVYDYITYKIETKYIFSFINLFIDKKIIPGNLILSSFIMIYSSIYFLVVCLYMYFFMWLFNIPVDTIYIIPAGVSVSFLVMYLNFHNDLNNFKMFLIEIESIVKELYDKSKKDKKEELKIKTA